MSPSVTKITYRAMDDFKRRSNVQSGRTFGATRRVGPFERDIHASCAVFSSSYLRVTTLSSRNRSNKAVRAGGVTWQPQRSFGPGQLRKVVATLPREVRDVAPLRPPWDRRAP